MSRPIGSVIVENGIPETIASGAERPRAARIAPTCLGRRRKPRKNAKRSSGWSRRGRFCSGTGGPPGKRPHPGREVAHFIADILLQLIVDPIDLPFAADVVEAQPNHHTVLAL